MARKLQSRIGKSPIVGNRNPSVLLPQEIIAIEGLLGIRFRDKQFLEQAFIHRSYLNEARRIDLRSNERLEFLGDAVLDFVVAEYLYRSFRDAEEGIMTAYRGVLVSGVTLTTITDELQIAPYLRMSRGEQLFFERNGKSAQWMKANLYEAVIGAIYLDRGVGAVELFLNETLLPKLDRMIREGLHVDPKSKLQELAQKQLKTTPTYRVLSEEGPAHKKWFQVGVFTGDRQLGSGYGASKPEAEVEAAKSALEHDFSEEPVSS